jgi:hypothetical protein
MPLKIAFAQTLFSILGDKLDRAIIDCKELRSDGAAYTALAMLPNGDGLSISGKFDPLVFVPNPQVVDYYADYKECTVEINLNKRDRKILDRFMAQYDFVLPNEEIIPESSRLTPLFKSSSSSSSATPPADKKKAKKMKQQQRRSDRLSQLDQLSTD